MLGCPVLVGLSRKSTVYKTLHITAAEALNGTTVLNTVALQHGADILRVHDVKEAREAILLLEAYKKSAP
jgi:dihydropteroate synthase